ncbi:MAG: glycosyltransferase [Nitrospirae bacterium]|nr:MAG: glycosyltransferase [Nitrospirota bacterium]
MHTKIKYSIVMPACNSEDIVGTTIVKTLNFCREQKLDFEFVVVEDGSRDHTWDKIRSLAEKNKEIIAVSLLKNYGQHTAVYCGFGHASGDFVITMDDDMQNPPEEIIHLIRKADEGYDAVFGKFRKKRHHPIRRLGSKVIGYLNARIFGKPEEVTLSNFRIIRRDVIQRILEYKTNYPYIPGLVLMFSGRIANVDVEHHERAAGKSNYGVLMIAQVVSRILFNYSSYPLRLFSIVSFVVSFISLVAGCAFLAKKLLIGAAVPGWTSLAVIISFSNCLISAMLGMLGEYMGRLINQTSSSRGYYIKEVVTRDPK